MRPNHFAYALATALLVSCAPTQRPDATQSQTPPPASAAPTAAPSVALAATATAVPAATPAPTGVPSAPASAAAQHLATVAPPVATAVPKVVPTATIAVAATPTSDVLESEPAAPPQIVRLDLNKTVLHGGDTVSGMVVTSSNVASVVAHIANFTIEVPRVSVGHFALSYTVPDVPFFLHGHYALEVIAKNAAGVTAQRSVDILMR